MNAKLIFNFIERNYEIIHDGLIVPLNFQTYAEATAYLEGYKAGCGNGYMIGFAAANGIFPVPKRGE